MLHALSEQDENSVQTVGGFARAGGKHDASRPKGLAKTPFGPSTTRKALGNITNFKQAPPRSCNLPPEKRGLTTSKPLQKQPQPGLKTKGLKHQEPALKPETAQAPSKLAQRAEQYAQEGIEIRAGKSWHEQESERTLRIQHEIEARVEAICCWRYPMTPPSIQGPNLRDMEESFACLYARPPELPDSPRSSLATAGDSDDAFRIEDLPEISQPEWSIEIKPGMAEAFSLTSDSDYEGEDGG